MIGPGKYDTLCEKARNEAGAIGAILIIYKGTFGSGFSVQLPGNVLREFPKILRNISNEIEKDNNKLFNEIKINP